MLDLQNKIALVTGASGSIGEAAAILLQRCGAEVIISGTNEAKLSALAAKLGNKCTIAPCDLKDVAACQALIDNTPKLDILVCNAGITNDTLAIRMSNEAFDEVVAVNLKASFILNRSALQKMIRQKYGRIINISSVVAVAGNPGQANYCAAKAGLIGMTKSMAHEVASRNVTINAVAPGFIRSNMTDKLTEEQRAAILQKIPMKNLGKPEDVANVIAFLASDAASYITGQTIHVNGGMLMV